MEIVDKCPTCGLDQFTSADTPQAVSPDGTSATYPCHRCGAILKEVVSVRASDWGPLHPPVKIWLPVGLA